MERFQNLLSKIGDNYKESYIVDNERFLYGGADRRKFDHEFFGANFFARHPFKIGTLQYSHLLNENNDFLDFNAFVQKTNLNINEEKFNVVRRSAMDVKEEHENLEIVKKGVDLLTFVTVLKKVANLLGEFSGISPRKRFRGTSIPTQKIHKL
jgi:hypothetical protein